MSQAYMWRLHRCACVVACMGVCFHAVCASMEHKLPCFMFYYKCQGLEMICWLMMTLSGLIHTLQCLNLSENHIAPFEPEVSIEPPKNPRIWLWKPFENQWSIWFTAVCREKLSRGQCLYHIMQSHTHCMNRTPSGVGKNKSGSAWRVYLALL